MAEEPLRPRIVGILLIPHPHRMKTLSRQQLYDLVWTRPVTELAKEFEVSEYILWSICKKHNVPRPGMHYWHKLKRGIKPETPSLPTGPNEQITIARDPFRPGRRLDAGQPPSALNEKALEDLKITFRDSVAEAHKLVRATKANLSSYTNFRDCYEANGREPHLWIDVSKATLTRALLLLDAIVRGLESLGIKMEGDKAIIGNEHVRFGVYERTDREEADNSKSPWNKYKYILTGVLTFRIQTVSKTYAWSDEPGKPLEKRTKFLIREIFVVADKMKEHTACLNEFHRRMDEERKRDEEAWRILEQQQAEVRRRQEQEQLRRQKLEQAAHNWDQSRRLCSFLNECENVIGASHSAEAAVYLTWARNHAKRLDPFQNGYLPHAIAEFAQATATTGDQRPPGRADAN